MLFLQIKLFKHLSAKGGEKQELQRTQLYYFYINF
jgi:hypothetical protein